SEEPIFMYAQQIGYPLLDNILQKFGQITDTLNPTWEQHKNIDVPAAREFPYWTLYDWIECLRFYTSGQMRIHPVIAKIIHNINGSPRALLKYIKFFKNQNITFPLFFKTVKKRLETYKVKKRSIDTFEYLWSHALLTENKCYDISSYTALSASKDEKLLNLDEDVKFLTAEILARLPTLKSHDPFFNEPCYVLTRFREHIYKNAIAKGLRKYHQLFYIKCFNILRTRRSYNSDSGAMEETYTVKKAQEIAAVISRLVHSKELEFLDILP
ncbi:unnamed protein product, partial [marine sediment metagenome]